MDGVVRVCIPGEVYVAARTPMPAVSLFACDLLINVQVRSNFKSAARQGAAAFGDAGVFVEKYVQVRP